MGCPVPVRTGIRGGALTFQMVTVCSLPLKFTKPLGFTEVGDASLWETSPPMVV